MQGNRKVRIGTVVSNKMDKTVVVAVETRRAHSFYRHVIRHITKFKAHDDGNQCGIGDTVMIEETRPLSKEKHWRVTQVLVRGKVAEVQPTAIDLPVEEVET